MDFFSKPQFEIELFDKVMLTNAHKKIVDKINEQENKEKKKKDKQK